MGLLQQSCETFESFKHLAGIVEQGKTPLAPIAHTLKSADIEVTVDADGAFQTARTVDKDEPKIIIPVTMESAGRVAAPCAHPLCDYLSYIAPKDREKHDLYVEQLSEWANSEFSHPKLMAILKYVQNGSILRDLAAAGVIELNEDGGKKDDKLFVRWVVNGLGEEQSGPCWSDLSLFRSFIDYYANKLGDAERGLCMVYGSDETLASQHPKGVISSCGGNAKLISANDTVNFTFRGRFSDSRQAATVSYEASQKAHNALSWIAANQGVRVALPGDSTITTDEQDKSFSSFGGRTFLCWNPHGRAVPQPFGAFCPKKTSAGKNAPIQEYRQRLRDALYGWKTDLPLTEGVVIAAFDAATTGRLSLTYYNELRASDFLERMYRWDDSCCWYNGNYGIQSPALYHIANFAFGTPRDGRFVTDDRILRQQMQRLISCRIDGVRFPLDIERRLVQRASNMAILGGEMRERFLFTACAAIQKYYFDRNETRWSMETKLDEKDRSFQFGRLLAVMERAEQYYYWRTGESGQDTSTQRETNAIRMLGVYVQRPFATFGAIDKKLRTAYLPRISPGQKGQYLKLAGEIVAALHELGDKDLNKPLSDKYLLGYYLQRDAMKSKNKTDDNEEE